MTNSNDRSENHQALTPIGRAALELAQEYGFPVFPVYEPTSDGCSCSNPSCERIAKHPRNENGFHGATTSAEQIADWWDRWPTANIGLYPGAAQLIVLDIDGPEGEAAARAAGAFDVPTLEVLTRRGVHRYFRLPAGLTVGNIPRKELDVRAHAGYVLAPPSVHSSGHVYQWRGDRDEIADVPAAVLEAIQRPRHTTVPTQMPPAPSIALTTFDRFTERRIVAYTDCVGYGLSDGRKCAAYRLAAFYRFDVGLADDLAWRCLALWNASNSPPLGEQILAEIHTNAGRYARGAA